MKNTRRMKRMARNRKKRIPAMNLTALVDVFTILVFFLLVNSSASEVLEPPKIITLPDSVVETKPKETAVIIVSEESVTVQGEMVVTVEDIIASKQDAIVAISSKLESIKNNVIGVSTKVIAESREVTILSHKTVPFKVLRKVMSSCTFAGYEKISLAVIQKAKQG
ncbi:MAG: biopolymer transporter ExbD [Gammaproteobacteria bacterium]|nr:biopolymer transporter ExbD [Gammaproteobacteria bacterium]